jgi:hypothetical protein
MRIRTRAGRSISVLLLLAVVATAFGITGTAGPAGAAIPQPPNDDPFYVPPAGFEAKAPGSILRTRSVTVTGLGIPIPVKSTQMLVRSTDARGQAIAVVSTLMMPLTFYLGRRPLLSYQPATDSLGDQCDPSYGLQIGLEKELPLMALGLAKGWAVVVTDYQGPLDAYGAGILEGQTTLDGIRAAEKLSGTGLSGTSTPVGMWGYSGGALATGWATQLQPSYAPELKVKGSAAGGTPSDLQAAGYQIDGGPFSGLFLAAAVGISRQYPEVLTLMNDDGRDMINRIGDMCYAEESVFFPFRRLEEFTTVADPLSHPIVAGILQQNKLGADAPTAPVYLYHSVFDELIPFSTAQELRGAWCDGGAKVQFHTDYASEHIVLAVTGAPAAIGFLEARFWGLPAPSNC